MPQFIQEIVLSQQLLCNNMAIKYFVSMIEDVVQDYLQDYLQDNQVVGPLLSFNKVPLCDFMSSRSRA
jgi:hypothetical protein